MLDVFDNSGGPSLLDLFFALVKKVTVQFTVYDHEVIPRILTVSIDSMRRDLDESLDCEQYILEGEMHGVEFFDAKYSSFPPNSRLRFLAKYKTVSRHGVWEVFSPFKDGQTIFFECGDRILSGKLEGFSLDDGKLITSCLDEKSSEKICQFSDRLRLTESSHGDEKVSVNVGAGGI